MRVAPSHLEAELFAACHNVRNSHLNKLREAGVTPRALAALGHCVPPFGVARVRFLASNLFEFDPDGTPAVIVGAFGPADLGKLGVEDLIAFELSAPARWHWRLGNVSCLGSHLLDDERWEPVPIVKDPLDWLRAAGQALVILDWETSSPIWDELRTCPGLTFPDETMRRRVEGALIRSVPLPTMEIKHAQLA